MRYSILLAAVVCISCGGGGNSSPAPSPTPPPPAQVAGVWTLRETVTASTGGECFASAFQTLIGTSGTGTIQITQAGASLSARATDDNSGASCDYTGTAGTSTIALNTTSCTASDVIGATCPNGARRDIRLQTGGYNVSVSGGTATGTGAQTYNVNIAGTSTPVGTLTLTSSVSATRR